MEVTTGTVTASDGVELYTRRRDAAEPRASILIVHGAGEHCGRWDHVSAFLAYRGYAVTAFDLRGHGESGGPRFHVDDFDHFVDDVATVAETLDPALPWVLYGHSMGGLIGALYLESDRPQPAAGDPYGGIL